MSSTIDVKVFSDKDGGGGENAAGGFPDEKQKS